MEIRRNEKGVYFKIDGEPLIEGQMVYLEEGPLVTRGGGEQVYRNTSFRVWTFEKEDGRFLVMTEFLNPFPTLQEKVRQDTRPIEVSLQ